MHSVQPRFVWVSDEEFHILDDVDTSSFEEEHLRKIYFPVYNIQKLFWSIQCEDQDVDVMMGKLQHPLLVGLRPSKWMRPSVRP